MEKITNLRCPACRSEKHFNLIGQAPCKRSIFLKHDGTVAVASNYTWVGRIENPEFECINCRHHWPAPKWVVWRHNVDPDQQAALKDEAQGPAPAWRKGTSPCHFFECACYQFRSEETTTSYHLHNAPLCKTCLYACAENASRITSLVGVEHECLICRSGTRRLLPRVILFKSHVEVVRKRLRVEATFGRGS